MGRPHQRDVPLRDIIELVLAARPAAISFEAANPRHAHEWTVFEDIDLPEGKLLIPGVIDSTTKPGPTDTQFFERANMTDTKVGQAEKDDPAGVARRGFEAMMAGKDSVLGGELKSRPQGLAHEVVPETVKASQVGKMAKPGSGSPDPGTKRGA